MEKLLINDNVDRANSDIQNLTQHGKAVSETIRFWNSQPALSPLSTAKSVSDFLKDPLDYLDKHVLSDTGVTFGAHKPDPRMIAQMFRIQYDELVRKISTSQARNLNVDLFTFEPDGCEIVLSAEGKEIVRERARIYLTDPNDIAQYNKLKGISNQLNELCKEFNVGNPEINQISRALPFFVAVPGKAGEGWSLGPNVNLIRHKNGRTIL